MPKSKKRKKTTSRASDGNVAVQEKAAYERPASQTRRPVRYGGGGAGLQKVTFAAMLTLGFLGMAIFFTFFYTEDPNHYFYGGVAALTALGWLVLLAQRWSQYRQRA